MERRRVMAGLGAVGLTAVLGLPARAAVAAPRRLRLYNVHTRESFDSVYFAEGDYLPIVRVAPVYPARALSRGLEGYVDLSFTVTTTGTVRDPVVMFSTSSLFERAALRAVLKFKYKPRVVDGVPVDVPNVKTRISFKIED